MIEEIARELTASLYFNFSGKSDIQTETKQTKSITNQNITKKVI
jgi:hypothetical protein